MPYDCPKSSWVSMRDLFRRVSFLFWQYPILWLPVLAADLLKFLLVQLDRTGGRAIANHFAYHSALSGAPEPLSPYSESIPKIVLLTGLLNWSVYFVSIGLYSLALVGTVALIRKKIEASGESFWVLFSGFQATPGRLAALSAKVLGLYVIAAIPFMLLIVPFGNRKSIFPVEYSYFIGVLMSMVAAYVAAPIAIRWLQWPKSISTSKELKRNVQAFAALMLLASGLMAIGAERVSGSLIFRSTSYIAVLGIRSISSMVEAVPFIPLFIAISLVAFQEEGEVLDYGGGFGKAAESVLPEELES